ncbi:MAG: family 43 glycosylhydrolase [Cellvibrio sp.]
MILSKLLRFFSTLCVFMLLAQQSTAIQLNGTTDMHDPSTILKDGDRYWTFGTGGGASNFPINALYSYDLVNWQRGPSPIAPNTRPSWIANKVPGFDGNFWAPDIIHMNGRYYLYYSAFSSTSGMHSAIGVMVTNSLNNPSWQDLGMVVSTVDDAKSASGQPVNAIDAGVFRDLVGRVWMVYGSHYAGIYMVQIDPSTGKKLNSTRYGVVGNNGNWHEFEAAQVQFIDGFYYMFVNLGECCAGNQSTYYVVVGRSEHPTGPFYDKNGRNLWDYGGSSVLSTSGNYIGPGHFGYLNNNGQHLASIHYYDGTTSTGWPGRLDLLQMNMVDGWPTFTRSFTLNPTTSPPASVSVQTGRVTFTSRLSGKLLEVASADQADGANVVQWSNLGGTNQQWDIASVGDGYYSIRAVHSGKSLDILNFSGLNGGDIRQWTYFSNPNQQWRFVDAGNGYYGIISKFNNLALDVLGFSTADGGDVVQWQYLNGHNQHWQIQYVGAASSSKSSSSAPKSSSSAPKSSSSAATTSKSSSSAPRSSSSAAASSSGGAPVLSGTGDYPSGFSKCAELGGTCSVTSGDGWVAFGRKGKWVTKKVSIGGSIACTVAAFGSDPGGNPNKCSYKR